MKFQIVEQPRQGRPFDDRGDANSALTEIQTSDDPNQGLKVGTARLVSGVRQEAQQISECVAEVTALAAQAVRAGLRRYDRSITARPPTSFHAARFAAPAGKRPEMKRPATGTADDDGRRRRP